MGEAGGGDAGSRFGVHASSALLITADDELAAGWPDERVLTVEQALESDAVPQAGGVDVAVVDIRRPELDPNPWQLQSAVQEQLESAARFSGTYFVWVVGTDEAPMLQAYGENRPLSGAALAETLATVRMLPRVLAVDDDANVRLMVTVLLEHVGFRVVTAPDGQAGLERARQLLPDLIITGIMMPKLSGWETLQALKADPTTAHIPVIVLTGGMILDHHIQRGYDLGCVDYITKPFAPDTLVESARIHSLRPPLGVEPADTTDSDTSTDDAPEPTGSGATSPQP